MKAVAIAIGFLTVGAIAGGSLASPLLGPRGEFKVLFRDLEYSPERACTKPRKPYSSREADASSYPMYLSSYRDCLLNTSKTDADYAIEVIKDGYRKAIDESDQ